MVVKHFDSIAAHYADAYSSNNLPASFFFGRRREIISRLLEQNSGGTLLDAGCGPGPYAAVCSRLGFRYYGLDASSGMIAEANQKYGKSENVSFHVGNIESLPFRDKSFDIVLCLGVLEYIDRTHVPIALAEFRRVLKPGGILIVSALNRLSAYWLWTSYVYLPLRFFCRNAKAFLKRLGWGKSIESYGQGLSVHRFRMPTLRKLLQALHFRSIEHNYFAIGIVPEPLDNCLLYRLVNAQSLLETLVNIRGLSWLARAFIVKATRNDKQATVIELERKL